MLYVREETLVRGNQLKGDSALRYCGRDILQERFARGEIEGLVRGTATDSERLSAPA